MMSHEYGDALTARQFDLAVRLTLRLAGADPADGLRGLAEHVVEELFCSCVTGAEDMAEGHRSAIHSVVVEEVVRQAQVVRARGGMDEVELASEQSFPSSDPPAWIWRR